MSHFFSLPREVRDMGYGYCLVVGKVFPGHAGSKDHRHEQARDFERSNAALLRASRLTHREAERVLYAQNTFVMPFHLQMLMFDFFHLNGKDLRYNRGANEWIQTIELRLEALDLSAGARKRIITGKWEYLENEVIYRGKPQPRRGDPLALFQRDTHDALERGLKDVWKNKVSTIDKNFAQLKELLIYLDNSFCSTGRHNMKVAAVDSPDFGLMSSTATIRFLANDRQCGQSMDIFLRAQDVCAEALPRVLARRTGESAI
ncbi:MAG: hypothetical protein M1830_004627 [Pleopsidium flavum]|nr:MAG: hypothetical protein M1830_004627 [Pleopsidium flavum]